MDHGAGRSLHVVVELAAILGRRIERGVQGAFDAKGPQFTGYDCLQPAFFVDRNEVTGAMVHRLLNACLVNRLLDCYNGHFRLKSVLLLDDLSNRIRIAFAIDDNQLDTFSAKGIVEFPGILYPVAMCGMPCIAQSAVHELDVVLILGQDRDGNALLIVQMKFPDLCPC